MNFNLTLRAEGESAPTKYTLIEEGVENLFLTFSSIQGSGYVRVYLKRLTLFQRLETISLFDESFSNHTIYFTFEAGDEIGFSVSQSGQENFSANLSVVSAGAIETGNSGGNVSADVLNRISALEAIVNNTPTLDPFLNDKLTKIQDDYEVFVRDIQLLRTDLTSLGNNFNTSRADLTTRLANAEDAIEALSNGSSVVSEPVIKVSLSQVSGSTYFIDLGKRTDYVITLDAAKTIQFSGEATLGHASVSFKNPATGTIFPVTFGETVVWSGGAAPVWNNIRNQGDLALFRSFDGVGITGVISQKNVVYGA